MALKIGYATMQLKSRSAGARHAAIHRAWLVR
jgi:hypothetical protein